MSKNAIAFLAGLGSGYMTAGKDKEKQKRDDEDRALRNKASQLQIDQAEQTITDRRTIAQAGAPIAMVEGAGGMVKPATMDNRDVGLPENAALPNQGLQEGGYSVGGKAFTDPAAAQAELATQNAPEARTQRVLAAQYGIDPMKAIGMQRDMTQGKLADAQLRSVEDAQKHDAAFREVSENFMRQGWSSVPKIYENYNDGNSAKVVEDGKGGAVVSILNKDGQPVGQKAFANEMEFITGQIAKLDPKLWVSMKEKQADKAQAQSNADRSFRLQANADKRADRADARAGAAASRAQNPGMRKVEETENILGRKLTQPERERLAGVGKDDDKGDAAFATDIVKEAVKGGMKPEDAPAARQELLTQIKSGRHFEKTRAAAERAKSDGKMHEFVSDMRKAGRSDADILAVGGELPKAESPAPRNTAQTMPALAPARPQIPSGLTPQAEAAGVVLDQARTAYQQAAAAKAPGLASGRPAIDAYAANLAQLKAQEEEAQRVFEAAVGAQRPAFARQGI